MSKKNRITEPRMTISQARSAWETARRGSQIEKRAFKAWLNLCHSQKDFREIQNMASSDEELELVENRKKHLERQKRRRTLEATALLLLLVFVGR